MSDQTITPVLPVTKTSNNLKNKETVKKPANPVKDKSTGKKPNNKKNGIDTYA